MQLLHVMTFSERYIRCKELPVQENLHLWADACFESVDLYPKHHNSNDP